MGDAATVHVFDSQGQAYHDAFAVFLAHTDQKANARRWLDGLVQSLPERRAFIDAGAGNGQVTAWFTDCFERTIAIEPNPALREDLARCCPRAEILPTTILAATPAAAADLVLCSHVLYYVDRSEWSPTLHRMASWLAPQGTLVVVLQNHETDCMKMLEAFHGRRFDLTALMHEFEMAQGQRYSVKRELVPAHVTTADVDTALVIAEFMLNLVPMSSPPARSTLQAYIAKHFAQPGGGYRFSCHQDFCMIRPRRQAPEQSSLPCA